MMVRQVARQYCRLREVYSLVYGRRASGENGRKLTASTRVGSQNRLMDYLGLIIVKRSEAGATALMRIRPSEPGGSKDAARFVFLAYTETRTTVFPVRMNKRNVFRSIACNKRGLFRENSIQLFQGE